MSVGTNNQHSVNANDVRDALENSWSDFKNNLQEENFDGVTEVLVEVIVTKVLNNIEAELGE